MTKDEIIEKIVKMPVKKWQPIFPETLRIIQEYYYELENRGIDLTLSECRTKIYKEDTQCKQQNV